MSDKEKTIGEEAGNMYRQVIENSERDSRLIQALIDASAASIVVLDDHRNIVFANRPWRQFTARTGSHLGDHGVGRKYPDLFAGIASASYEDAAQLKKGLEKIIEGEELEFELKYRCTAEPTPVWFQMHAATFSGPGTDDSRLILVTHEEVSDPETRSKDVGPNDEEVLLRESALAELTGRLITAQEEERKRIARELHDDLNQRIALISIELEQVAQKAAGGSSSVPLRLRSIQRKVAEISTEIHRISHELHPSKLDHLGLVLALRSFCNDLAKSRGIVVDFKPESVPALLDRDVTLNVFRVAQEAMQNAAKHSGTPSIEVTLKGSSASLDLIVSDNGNGFRTSPEKLKKGLGLTSMQERVRLVGGDFRITSEPGQGTVVSISVPLMMKSESSDITRSHSTLKKVAFINSRTKGAPNETYKNYFGRRSYAAN